MQNIKTRILQFIRREDGASALEYALMAAMVAVAVATFVPGISGAINKIFGSIQSTLQTSAGTGG